MLFVLSAFDFVAVVSSLMTFDNKPMPAADSGLSEEDFTLVDDDGNDGGVQNSAQPRRFDAASVSFTYPPLSSDALVRVSSCFLAEAVTSAPQADVSAGLQAPATNLPAPSPQQPHQPFVSQGEAQPYNFSSDISPHCPIYGSQSKHRFIFFFVVCNRRCRKSCY